VLPTAALGRDDLEAAGIVGLIQAIDRFAPERGIPFEGYAAFRIRGAILDEVRRLDDLSRDAPTRPPKTFGGHRVLQMIARGDHIAQ
jgi:RNA polymerase sigma factor FliA